MKTIHLDPAQVPASLRGSYSGRKFEACVCETVTIPATAGLWDGGSRETFAGVNIATGAAMPFPGQDSFADSSRREVTVTLQPGFAVVRRSYVQGTDLGLTFYVHPDNASKLLPAPTGKLSPYEKLVLIATKSLKSSYGGRDRYQMARDEYHCKNALAGLDYPTRAQWDATKADLIARGLLNKAGAITVAGKNAI